MHHQYAEIKSARIGIGHKVALLGVVLYIILNIIIGFGYMLQETPNAVVNAYVEESEYRSTVDSLKLSPPSYCDNVATDYNFSATWTYNNNKCAFDLDVGDILTKGENAVFITTYFQDTPSDAAAASAANLSAGNYFVPGVESMRMIFDHTVTTSWRLREFNPELHLRPFDRPEANAHSYPSGKSVSVTVADLLGIGGAELDTENTLDGSSSGPLYRLSGVHVRIGMKYSNMDVYDPLDRTVKTEGAVDFTKGVWTSIGPKMVYKPDASGKWHKFQRYHYALRVSFITTGTIGKPDVFATLTNLAVALGLLGVAVTVVDSISEYLVPNFIDMTHDNRNDWMTLESLKAFAVRQGHLQKFAEDNGMKLIRTKTMTNLMSDSETQVSDSLRQSQRVAHIVSIYEKILGLFRLSLRLSRRGEEALPLYYHIAPL